MITCQDWRGWDGARIEPLLDREQDRWRTCLGWDVRAAWSPIEPARAAGQLPGFVAVDVAGHVVGWTCFLVHDRVLQVATCVAASAAATRALVAATAAAADAAGASGMLVFTFPGAPDLADVLIERGFATETYRYLACDLSAAPASSTGLRPWQPQDAHRLPAACARAYRDSTELRPFAPAGRDNEWRAYCAQLLTGEGCGRFLPEASFAVDGRLPTHLAAVIVTTRLSAETAHIAQVIVAPDARQQRWGTRLVDAASSAAARAGCTRLTLLVASGNHAANGLYARLGFHEQAVFLAARR